MNKKKALLVGVAAAFGIAALLVVTSKRRPKRNLAVFGLVLAAIAGFAGAIAWFYHRRHKKRENLKLEQLIDSFDADRLDEHITEVLGKASDRLLPD